MVAQCTVVSLLASNDNWLRAVEPAIYAFHSSRIISGWVAQYSVLPCLR